MRALVLLLTLAEFMLPAYGAKRVTVAELEQTLATAHNLPDGDLAKELSNFELTERLNTARFDRMESALPGEQSRQKLMILADESAFLDPPATEIPSEPAPDPTTQRKMLALTVDYVTQTLHKLPNFFATRITNSFEDSPAVTRLGATTTAYQPIHLVDDSNVTVTFREGREVVEKSSFDPRIRSLTTSGVFGPILGTVLVDAARSKLAWSHWEQSQTGLQAVFSYEVPKENSHYTITYDSVPTNVQGQDPCTTTPHTFKETVAYHGEMAVDPASGTILRLTLLADLKPNEFTASSDIGVEYGQVSISGKNYFLPVRSVTSSLAHFLLRGWDAWGNGQGCPTLSVTPSLQRSLNDVVFENYHVFRSNARILTEGEAAHLASQPAEPAPSASSATAITPQPVQHKPEPAPAANQPQPIPPPNSAPIALPSPAEVASVPPNPAPANSVPSVNSAGSADFANIPVFRTTARQVLVDVVVDNKKGDPVSGIPESDFFIEEEGKPQTIDFFEEHSATTIASAATPSMPPLPTGAVTNVPVAPPTGVLNVLLLDSLNTEPQDQIYVRRQILAFLQKLDQGTQVAVFSLGSSLHLLQGFTSNPTALIDAVSDKKAERDAMAQTRSDNADDADAIASLQASRSNGIEGLKAAQANIRAYSFGARASMTFEALNALAGYLEGIPGRKNLIWFASSFPVVFFPTPTQLDQLKSNPNLPGYINHIHQTANLFTLSKIAVYPVTSGGIASSNIGLADWAGSGRTGGSNGTGALVAESLDSASAFSSMEQLASSTGGHAFETNDIDNALRKIVHDSNVYYTVGYAPTDSAAEGSFRRVDVKVAGSKYKLSYRQGYNAGPVVGNGAPSVDPIASLLRLDLPNATGIYYGATATLGTDHPSETTGQNVQVKGPLSRYTISFTVRAQDVSFNQAPNGERIAKFLIGVKAYGKDGTALNWQASREALELDVAHYQSVLKSGIPISIDLDLPIKTPAQIVTAVYDWSTGRAGTLEIPLHR